MAENNTHSNVTCARMQILVSSSTTVIATLSETDENNKVSIHQESISEVSVEPTHNRIEQDSDVSDATYEAGTGARTSLSNDRGNRQYSKHALL